jgi:hypothetical protein
VQGKQQTLDALTPVLGQIRKEAARDLTVRFVADLVGVSPQAVLSLARPARSANDGASTMAALPLSQREGRHQRRVLRLLLEQRGLLSRARQMLRPENLADPALRTLLERLLQFSDDEFAQIDPAMLMERHPDVAPVVRALLLDEQLHLRAVGDQEAQFQDEVADLKKELKDDLWRRFRAAVGTPEEELALRRYKKLRDELTSLKVARSNHKPRPEVTLRSPPRAV